MFVLPAKFLADDVKVGIFREIRFVSVRKVGRLQQKNFPAGLREKIFQKNSSQQHRLGLDCGDPASRRLDWSRIAAIRRLSQQEAMFVHIRFYLPGE